MGRLHRTAVLSAMSTLTYLIALTVVLTLAATGKPGPILAASVLLVLVTTAHALITNHESERK